MDRNLGARDTNFDPDGKGLLFWQFGRVSPVPGGPEVGESTSGYLGTTKVEYKRISFIRDVAKTKVTIRAAISSPLTFYKSNDTGWNWSANLSSDLNWEYEWNDVKVARLNKAKSIFDPSPAGWRLPRVALKGTSMVHAFNDFSRIGNTVIPDWLSSENKTSNPGMTYRNFAFHPAVGRVQFDSNIYARYDNVCLWYSTSYDKANGYRILYSISGSQSNATSFSSAYGTTTRCVSM